VRRDTPVPSEAPSQATAWLANFGRENKAILIVDLISFSRPDEADEQRLAANWCATSGSRRFMVERLVLI
jgi:hypothetical protein